MKKIIALSFLLPQIMVSQILFDTIKKSKQNPIIYADFSLGISREFGNAQTVFVGGSLNYQTRNNLFSFRFIENSAIKTTWFIIVPVFVTKTTNQEFGLLYGKRYIEDGTSYSFSGGICYNNYKNYFYEYNKTFIDFPEKQLPTISTDFIGFPFEAEIRWFKPKKEKFRIIYALLPIGKPTALGRSFGIKLIGNISKQSYAGIGISMGIGWHKLYQ